MFEKEGVDDLDHVRSNNVGAAPRRWTRCLGEAESAISGPDSSCRFWLCNNATLGLSDGGHTADASHIGTQLTMGNCVAGRTWPIGWNLGFQTLGRAGENMCFRQLAPRRGTSRSQG